MNSSGVFGIIQRLPAIHCLRTSAASSMRWISPKIRVHRNRFRARIPAVVTTLDHVPTVRQSQNLTHWSVLRGRSP